MKQRYHYFRRVNRIHYFLAKLKAENLRVADGFKTNALPGVVSEHVTVLLWLLAYNPVKAIREVGGVRIK
jgi:hypothetical protein